MPKICCYCFSPKLVRFENGSNKVAIELRAIQFWTEIIPVISNRTRATGSFDLEITRMISDQIALHSVQLPLFIGYTKQGVAAPKQTQRPLKFVSKFSFLNQ